MYRDGIHEMLLARHGRASMTRSTGSALLAAYRGMIVETDTLYGCPIGSLALELHEPDPKVRDRWRPISAPD
jgi:hypothetical protein